MQNIAAKLLAIQKEIQPILKTEDNPFFKSKYADINGVIAALRPLLNKHGVVVLQPLGVLDGKAAIRTSAIDAESGEKIEDWMPMPDFTDAQKAGATITYFRRYALMSFFLLETEDDDGNTASGIQNAPQTRTTPLTPTGTQKTCEICGNVYNPKPGTEAWSKNCYDCWKAGKVPKKDKTIDRTEDIPF
ncbi:MAG: ERF family protein [Patescibacteria group bacterium]|nr:ERF family protein [Patescibacteria group bacterium]